MVHTANMDVHGVNLCVKYKSFKSIAQTIVEVSIYLKMLTQIVPDGKTDGQVQDIPTVFTGH